MESLNSQIDLLYIGLHIFIFSFTQQRAYDSSVQAVQSHSQLVSSNTTHEAEKVKHKCHLVEEDYDSMSMSNLSVEVKLYPVLLMVSYLMVSYLMVSYLMVSYLMVSYLMVSYLLILTSK